MYSYSAYGLSIRSELPLPELLSGEGADVVIRLGAVDRACPPTAIEGEHFWATADEFCFFRREVGSLFVSGGREITVDPAPGADDQLIRLFLLGPALAALLHQRGMLMLHASAVAVDGAAIAFLGQSGSGKSTTARALYDSGCRLVADDVVAVDVRGRSGPIVLPAFPQLKLWPESAAALGDDPLTLPTLHPQLEKRRYGAVRRFSPKPLPLGRVYLLRPGRAQEVAPLGPREALVELVRHSFCARLLPAGGAVRHLRQCSMLASSVPIRRLTRSRSLEALARFTSFVEDEVVTALR